VYHIESDLDLDLPNRAFGTIWTVMAMQAKAEPAATVMITTISGAEMAVVHGEVPEAPDEEGTGAPVQRDGQREATACLEHVGDLAAGDHRLTGVRQTMIQTMKTVDRRGAPVLQPCPAAVVCQPWRGQSLRTRLTKVASSGRVPAIRHADSSNGQMNSPAAVHLIYDRDLLARPS